MAAYKILALFALLALSASAATTITTMPYLQPTIAMGNMDPCRQYMMQTTGTDSYATMFMPQPIALLQQYCQMIQNMQYAICGGLGQQQMMMKMAMQLPNMCSMAPAYFQLSPYGCC
ncbi:hypothetical protein DAI22_03g351000 [Oryza sativa Japonica Group]|nr:hypothetical protein DAI22_03g351000 [Oryza sativa Japonica Group]